MKKRKLHALNWKLVTLPKKIGGLNISLTRERNLAMLSNFPWICDNNYGPWIRILKLKYSNPNRKHPRTGSANWKFLVHGKSSLERVQMLNFGRILGWDKPLLLLDPLLVVRLHLMRA